MKKWNQSKFLIGFMILCLVAACRADKSPATLLQEALYAEETEGDLDKVIGDCELDITARKLTRSNKEIKLSPKEFRLLEFFVKKQGRALTRDEILNRVWGYDSFVTHRSVDRFITTLRNKIEPDPRRPAFLHTIREIGYKFVIGNDL